MIKKAKHIVDSVGSELKKLNDQAAQIVAALGLSRRDSKPANLVEIEDKIQICKDAVEQASKIVRLCTLAAANGITEDDLKSFVTFGNSQIIKEVPAPIVSKPKKKK